MSIRQKLTVAALSACIVLGALGVSTVLYVRSALRDEVRTGKDALARIEAERIGQQLDATVGRLRDLATSPAVASRIGAASRGDRAALAALRRAVEEAPRDMRGLVGLRVYALDGRLLASAGRPVASADVLASDRALASRRSELRRPTDTIVGSAAAGIVDAGTYPHAVSIADRGGVSGVLVAQCSLAPITALVKSHDSVGPSAEAHLVQPGTGGAQFITPVRFDPSARWNKIIPAAKRAAPAIRALAGETGPIDGLRDYRNQQVIAAFRTIPTTPWALVVKVDQAEAYAGLRRVLWAIAAAFGAALLLVLGSALAVSRTVVRRIGRATESATAIARGDLGVRVGGHSGDEVGRFAAAFDRMADALAEDIERRERIEAQLEHLASHDQLTGLAGRARFEEALATALEDQRAVHGGVALLFCDLDDFKSVNDRLGHAAGDDLLRVVASRIQAVLRPQDLLARFGGDEFVVLCQDLGARVDAEAVAARLQGALDDPIQIAESEIRISISIGIAVSDGATSASEMLRAADEAMYAAKARGREGLLAGDARIQARRAYGLSLSGDLRRAIDQGELSLEYQPIVGLDSGAIVAVETLVRWENDGRPVPPSDFVAYAEDLGLAESLDHWVITNAMRQFAAWRADDEIEPVNLAVNMSALSVTEPRIADALVAEIEALGIPASSLCIEITEGALATGTDEVIQNLARLRSLGVRLAIDDFGIGHSSLARLRDLAVDTVKLDKALVRDADRDPAARSIVSAVVAMAGALGLVVAAEGIERARQRDTLSELGCQLGQGLLFAPPEPPARIRERLRRTRPADTGLFS